MFHDQVFVFTPKGEVIALPRGATPVDFAYAVHSQIGDTCVGAKINGRLLPLRTELNNGDQVEIVTSKAQTPSPTWERFVVTGKERAAPASAASSAPSSARGTSISAKPSCRRHFARKAGILGKAAAPNRAEAVQLRRHRGPHVAVGKGLQAAARSSTPRFRARASPGTRSSRCCAPAARAPARTSRSIPRAHSRHGAAFRRLLPPLARRPHRRYRHHRQGRDDPHDRLRYARNLQRRGPNVGSTWRGPATTPMRCMSAASM